MRVIILQMAVEYYYRIERTDIIMVITKTETKTEEKINQTTGEIELTHSEQTTTHTEKTSEPNFIKLYLDHLAIFNGVSLTVNPILAEILRRTTYADDKAGGHQVVINRAVKKRIAETLKCSESKINNAITVFVDNHYLKRLDRGLYEVNPNYFGKGDWGNIQKLRANYDYTEHTITTEIESATTAE